jgi:hypothetical protein
MPFRFIHVVAGIRCGGSVIPELWEDCKFKASLDYITKPCLKKKKCSQKLKNRFTI